MLQYRVAQNYEEYLEICKETHYLKVGENAMGDPAIPFTDLQDWEQFFQVELESDEDTVEYLQELKDFKGEVGFKPEPEEYPVILVYRFEKSYDRMGDLSIQIWDWKPIKDLIKTN